MTDSPEAQEMLRRFERDIDISKVGNSGDLIRKFKYWQNRKVSLRQEILLRNYARREGIEKPKPIGISKRKGKPREELRRHYTTHIRKGRRVMVARIPKGMKGAGRFAKRE